MAGGNSHQRAVEKARIDKQVSQTVAKYLEKDKPSGTMAPAEHRILPKEWALWCWAAVVALALYLAAPKLAPATAKSATFIGLVAMVVLLLLPFRNFHWIRQPGQRTKWIRFLPIILCAIVLVCLFGMWVWPGISYDSDSLRKMSKDQLIEATNNLSAQLYDFQNKHNQRFTSLTERSLTEAEVEKEESDFQIKYERDYLNNARTLCDELRWRLGMPHVIYGMLPRIGREKTAPYNIPLAFDDWLGGPNPISDAASYLTRLAAEL
jgi:hypothetical protein